MAHRTTAWTVTLMVLAQLAGRAVGQDLHAITAAAHVAARDSIRTCTCRVETTIESRHVTGGPVKQTGDYLRSGGAVRVKVKEWNGTRDIVYRDGTLWALNEVADSAGVVLPGGVVTKVGVYPPIDCDPWSRGLLVIPDPHSLLQVPYEKLVTLASGGPKAERWQDGGRTYVVVALKIDKKTKATDLVWDYTVWFDPAAKHLIRRVTMAATYGQYQVERDYRVLQFREAAPGVFFPERAEFISRANGKPVGAESMTVSDLVINRPVAAGALDLKFPRGVTVVDSVRGVTYVSDGTDGSPGPPPAGKAVPPAKPN